MPRLRFFAEGDVSFRCWNFDGDHGSIQPVIHRWNSKARLLSLLLAVCCWAAHSSLGAAAGVRVGTATAVLEADDDMVIAGGITAGKASGQEGNLRVVAIVVAKGETKLAIVACDILMITRQYLDPVVEEISKATAIPSANVLINCTHTHHAPSTLLIHGYGGDTKFTKRVQEAIVKAVGEAASSLSADECDFLFHLGREETVGQNSRMLLPDGSIYWVGPRDQFVRPTGPFDPELPVLGFRGMDGKLRATIFNHSTHTIGTRQAGRRSPSFYGLAAQELEPELGGVLCFLEGASGSTHNLNLTGPEMIDRIKVAVRDGVSNAQPRAVESLAAIKRPFQFKVRQFNEAEEDARVSEYCRKYVGPYGQSVVDVFREMRKHLAAEQGKSRETWIQAVRIGDVAIVGVPAEYFTQLGLNIKNRSPFRYTYVAELANDWIGYLPDQAGHKLGGYQVWTGYHSYAEPGTGERIEDAVVDLLRELR